MQDSIYRDTQIKWPVIVALIMLVAAVSVFAFGCNKVGTVADYSSTGVKHENPSPTSLVQISPGEDGGSTAINTIGPAQQAFVDAATGNIKVIGGGIANKTIALPTGGGKFLLVASQDDAVFEAAEIRDGTSGQVIAKGVKVSTNVSDPTKASVELVKTWGPVYVQALKQARLGNKDLYDAVVKSIEAAGPLVLDTLKTLYGVP